MPARLTALALLLAASAVLAQPTYRLDVRKDLKARASIVVEGDRVSRSVVSDDPGFRLQFHFKKDGKTIATPDARVATSASLPAKEPGVYTVVLELFHPGYKPGTGIKGQFQAVSDVITYRIDPGSPGKAVVVPPAPVAPPGPVAPPKKS